MGHSTNILQYSQINPPVNPPINATIYEYPANSSNKSSKSSKIPLFQEWVKIQDLGGPQF
jgi:hypothetical protein